MITIWALIRWIHLLAAIAWIGGQLFILLVLLPVMRSAMPPIERTLLFARVGERYGTLSWIALSILVVTGVLNGERRHIAWTELMNSDYGRKLALKLLFVAVVIVITLVHAFYYGRRLTRLAEEVKAQGEHDPRRDEQRRRLQVMSGILSGVNLVLNLAIILLAASLIA